MKKFILFAILGLLSWMAFAQVDIKQSEYYQVKVGDSLYSSHSQRYQAIEKMLNLQLEGIEGAYILPPPLTVTLASIPTQVEYVYDTIYLGSDETNYVDMVPWTPEDIKVSEIDYIIPTIEIDTIDVIECFEDYNKKTWLWTGPESVWVPFKETGLSHVKVDSLPVWKKILQDKWRLQRTKDHVNAVTEYTELEMPFQFMHDSIVSIGSTEARVRVFASEDWHLSLYVDGQKDRDLPDAVPGTQDFFGYPTRRHSITFNGLLPNTNYTLEVRGYSRLRKEEDVIYFSIKTLE